MRLDFTALTRLAFLVAAPEAKAEAPAPAPGFPGSASHGGVPGQLNEAVKRAESKIADGAGPAVGAPKPVEVNSVPDTPANGATPAGGTPRPELKIQEELAAANDLPKEPVVMTRVADPKPAPAASIEAASGDKRILAGEAARPPPAGGADNQPAAKKAKVDGGAAETNGGEAVNGSAQARKPGRPKKDKAAAPPMGRTARKTRSQGPAEA